MGHEMDSLARIFDQISRGEKVGEKLEFDPKTKSVKQVPSNRETRNDPDGDLSITANDLGHWGASDRQGQVIVGAEFLREATACNTGTLHTTFKGRGAELVFPQLSGDDRGDPGYPGTIAVVKGGEAAQVESQWGEDDRVRVLIDADRLHFKGTGGVSPGACQAYLKVDGAWVKASLHTVPTREDLFSRLEGLLETDVLVQKKVVVFGLGSGGSHTTIELAKSGVMNFTLIDHDRLEVANVVRHVCGIRDVGRLKVHAMADAIRDKNPFASVECWPLKVEWQNSDQVVELIKGADLVIAATDNQPSRLVINRACLQQNKTCIYAGAFRRAYGGQVLRVRPHKTLCYQCFVMNLPGQSHDEEISSQDAADKRAYTDRPVAIEPGLSSDIASIGLMVVKLALQELLQGTKSTLKSLDGDLVASWYVWLNRREPGTAYEALEPLGFAMDGLRVLRWYGIEVTRHPACPECGNFAGEHTLAEVEEEINRFNQLIGRLPAVE